jgi:pimeloyl-ACP methyl ester carboxylesterase
MELMFHGYRGNAERDLCGGVQRAFSLGHNVLIVDQRGSCHSDGRIISFGVNEHRDCLAWLDLVIREFGPDVQVILTGISMGATTVLLAAGTELPKNVIGVLADCGYTSAHEIIQVVAKLIKLPPKLSYPFVRLAARAGNIGDTKAWDDALLEITGDYVEPVPGAREKLVKVLKVMLTVWCANQMKLMADKMIAEM